MIARLSVHVPFYLLVPEGETFQIPAYSGEEYTVRFRPPGRSDVPLPFGSPKAVSLDERPAFPADVLVIDFCKEAFDRKQGSAMEPSFVHIQEALDWLIARLRFITRGSEIQTFKIDERLWRLQYLNDDETEIETTEGRSKGFGSIKFGFKYSICDATLWAKLFDLPLTFEAPVWDSLRLDAHAAVPHVGSSLVLMYTALEVFASTTAATLADRSAVPKDIWSWVQDRGDHYKEPSTEDNLDVLLKSFTGHSLKEEPELWDGFKQLRTARNKFAHLGIPMVEGKIVDLAKAGQLLQIANRIFSTIRSWLPADMQWPVYEQQRKLQVVFPLQRETPTGNDRIESER